MSFQSQDSNFHPHDVSRRARGATALLVGAFVFLGSAFFRAQVVQHESYTLQSRNNRLREVPLPAPRGIIYDRNGQIIAESVPGYSVLLTVDRGRRGQKSVEDSLVATLRRLGEVIPYGEEQIAVALRRHRREPSRPVVVIADADFATVSVLEERVADFPGLVVQAAPKRHYPDGPAVASFVGYTGEISEDELTKPEYVGYRASQQVGKSGLEKQYEEALRGKEGVSYIEVDARSRIVRREGVRPGQQPEAAPPLHTNIDLALQRFVYELMERDSSLTGGVIAMDPQTGSVLAMHSNPSFDPNAFTGGISSDEYAALRDDPRRPLYNKVIQGRYPPASTFKLMTAAIAMQRGLVTLDTHMPQPCTGGYTYGGRYFRCLGRHGDIDLRVAIAKSCNVYFYQLGQRIGMEQLLHDAVEMGFNQRSGIDLPNEQSARFPATIAYYDKRYGPRGWSRGSTLNLAIGQGENEATLANMTRLYTALATDGKAARPSIARGAPERVPALKLDAKQLAGLRLAMADVVSTRGTAGRSAIQGVTIAGKTGTAQNSENRDRDHAWFLGFAPAEDPKIVVGVFLAFGEHGSEAASLASRVIEAYLKRPAAPIPNTDETDGSAPAPVTTPATPVGTAERIGATGRIQTSRNSTAARR